jgi:putative hemolysin
MAIVLEAHGASAGTVTLEDLLEEIVGEIADEYHLPDESIRWIDDRTVHVAGSFPIDDFNERFGKHLPEDDYHTVGGFVFGELGRVPKVGDSVMFEDARFEVSAADGPRIREVDVTLTAPAGQTAAPPARPAE